MRFTLVVAALGAVALAGSAFAADEVSDQDYVQAHRCKGLAAGIGQADTRASIDEFLKAARRTKVQYPEGRAELEFDRARREAKKPASKDAVTAELSGACAAYAGAAPPK